jgi:hypothetical protein
MRSSIPNQAIPLSQKNSSWKKRTMDAFLSLSEGSSSKRLRDLGRLYDYYNGVLNPADYLHVTRPYGKERKNFPAKMRNYPIIKSTVDVLLGEKPKRPFNYSVVATNADAVDRREQAMMDLFVSSVSQGVVNNMNSAGLPTGEESKEIPKDLQAMFERTYVDNHAILGQKALTFIVRDQAIREKFCKAWFHFLVAGECFSERTVREDTVCYEILNPLNVSFDLDPDLDYVEDADWCVISRAMGPSAIVRNWGRFLTQDQINGMFTDNRFDPALLGRNSSDQMLTTVRTVYWMSQTRTGFVKYTDEMTGEEEEFTVEDGYTLPEELRLMGAKLTWEWHNQPWQGIRIGDDIDVDVRPVTEFRGSMDNPSRVKLPVNGRRYSDINSENISLVMLGVPYQVNYNIYQYRLETAIARSKDIVAQFDINMIPKKWDMDMFMYYVEGTGIAWVDYDKEGVRQSPQHQAVMDLSIKVIGQYIELLEYILRQWELVSGVSAQRRGEVGQYETKSMGQQAIVQSSHVTEDLYRKFAGFEQRDLQALLDCSRKAWVNGKKGVYVMPDGHREFFATDEDYPLSDMGVFVTDASEEVEKFNSARQLAEALVSHGGNLSAALDVLDGGSFAEMREKIRTAERTQQELQAAQEQAAQEVEKAKMAQERELADREFQLKEKELQQERELAEEDGRLQLRLKEMDLRKPQTNESR